MAITRRDFLKISGATGAGVLFGVFDLKPIVAYAQANPPVWGFEAITVCGYCSVGCSIIAANDGTHVTYTQGNPDSPINKGTLCSKGMASSQLSTIVSNDSGTRIPNPERLIAVKHRAAYATDWDTDYMSMDDAIGYIAANVKTTRDASFTEKEIVTGTGPTGQHYGGDNSSDLIDSALRDFSALGVRVGMTVKNTTDVCSGIVTEISSTHSVNDTLKFSGGLSGGTDNDWDTTDGFKIDQIEITVNRCKGVASLGAAALNNEACYMITKLMRSLGVVYLEHQARV